MRLSHFYHVYADGKWEEAVEEHIKALYDSKLVYNLKDFKIGLIGTEENQQKVKNKFREHNLKPQIADTAEEGFEQLTMEKIKEYADFYNDVYILYAHSKGAYDFSAINRAWRSSMCYYNVIKWETQVTALKKGYDIAGCH